MFNGPKARQEGGARPHQQQPLSCDSSTLFLDQSTIDCPLEIHKQSYRKPHGYHNTKLHILPFLHAHLPAHATRQFTSLPACVGGTPPPPHKFASFVIYIIIIIIPSLPFLSPSHRSTQLH